LAFGTRETVMAETLLLILRRELAERFALTVTNGAAPDCWLRIDSYAIVQAVGNLAGLLEAEYAVTSLELQLACGGGDLANLAIAWQEPAIPVEVVTAWEDAPLFMDADGRTHTPRSIVALHGGVVATIAGAEDLCREVRIALPVTVAGEADALPGG
jgi:hypothetical protein